MEYLEGKTLTEIVRRTRELNIRLPTDLSISIIIQVGRALSYVHQLCSNTGEPLNIVHRDIKPQNFMVSFTGHPKIVDFGISTFKFSEKLTATWHSAPIIR